MLTKKLVCTNLFKGVEGGFLLWHQMGLGTMNRTFEETQNKVIPADPSDPLFKKWVKVLENPIAKHHAKVVSNITFRDLIAVWQEDDGSQVFTMGSVIGETNITKVAYKNQL
jgi:hypothetical protein